jgi:uncharacterized zinc-type alcohol dehydrogenase-like protein
MAEMVKAFAAKSAKGKLEAFTYPAAALGQHEVRVDVKYCGICHSDIAMLDNEWGFSAYPLVPGHEVVGYVSEVGGAVRGLKVGQAVGVGWQSGSCAECEFCRRGKEHLCASERDTIVHRHGGWASSVVVDGKFAVPLPEGMAVPEAAPLLCAGNTVFGPMLHYGVTAGMSAAVVGIGGLGHLAVQFLAKWGCDVTAISSSHAKDEQVRQLGARHFIATRGTGELQAAANRFDYVISTVTADLDWNALLGTLRPEGTLVIVGFPESPIQVPAFGLVQFEKKIVGGRASSPADISKMLAFADRANVRAVVESFPLSAVNEAVDRVRSGKVRYRAVLKV